MIVKSFKQYPGVRHIGMGHDGESFFGVAFEADGGLFLIYPGRHVAKRLPFCPWDVADPDYRHFSKVYGDRLLVRSYHLDRMMLAAVFSVDLAGVGSSPQTFRPDGGMTPYQFADGCRRFKLARNEQTYYDCEGKVRFCVDERLVFPETPSLTAFDVRPGLAAYFGKAGVVVRSDDRPQSAYFTIREKSGEVRDVSISPDAKTILVISQNTLNFYCAATGELLKALTPPGDYQMCSWSPDGLTFAIFCKEFFVVMDYE